MVIVGIDEVGRGCWAGPVVAGAVALSVEISGLNDSKLLTKIARERLAAVIKVEALAYGTGWVDAMIIDKIGINASVKLAMERALAQISVQYDQVILDGNINFLADNPRSKAVVKADKSVAAVSAASIIAKIARDEYMSRQAQQFPGYGFERHVGYGTTLHLEAMQRLGICELHRKSYKPIKSFERSAHSSATMDA